MRILAVIPHYFGPSHPENNLPAIGSYIEPLGRIAALNEAIVGLHRHFGPNRYSYNGTAIPADAHTPKRQIDVVILAIRGHELISELGFAPGTIQVEYVDCKAPWIAFESQRIFRERLGQYDFYCFMEDDLIIHDPAFFDKLTWFQRRFGLQALLMPVRYEVAAPGSPAKVIVDPELPEHLFSPFRRAGQRVRLEGVWSENPQLFHLPTNPHAGSFFLTGEQMDYWVNSRATTIAIPHGPGRSKAQEHSRSGESSTYTSPLSPDPFFLEVHHFGVRYASQSAPEGHRYGESPLLSIAQNALRAALDAAAVLPAPNDTISSATPSFSRLVQRWVAQGTAVEVRGQLDALERQMIRHTEEIRELTVREEQLQRSIASSRCASRIGIRTLRAEATAARSG